MNAVLKTAALKTAVITGASEGLGLEFAKIYSTQGFRVVLLARNLEKLNKASEECKKSGAKEVWNYSIDVSDLEKQRQILEEVIHKAQNVDVFIANAGIGGNFHVNQDNWNDHLKVMHTNYLGAVVGLELMKVQMLKQGFGLLAGVSSLAANFGLPGTSGYSASKAALSTYLQSIRIELRKKNIQVFTLEPGYIRTALTSKNEGTMPFLMEVEDAAKQMMDQMKRGVSEITVPLPFSIGKSLLSRFPHNWIESILAKTMSKVGRGNRIESK